MTDQYAELRHRLREPRDFYPDADPRTLPAYGKHVFSMTAAGLHDKSDIAVQLALRDRDLTTLLAERDALLARLDIRQDTEGGQHDEIDRLQSALDSAQWSMERAQAERDALVSPSPSYDALLVISQSVAAALERAGVEECDDPGEAIDLMRERLEAINLSAPKNQCDGCQAGHEVRNGLHVNERGWGYMVCQSSKYPDERKAMEKDAARYRWLRDGAYYLIEPDRGLGPMIPCGDEMDIAVDAAIDAAMAGREGAG